MTHEMWMRREQSKEQLWFLAWVNSDDTDDSGNSRGGAHWEHDNMFDFRHVEFEVLHIMVEMSSK